MTDTYYQTKGFPKMETELSDLTGRQLISKLATIIDLMEVYEKEISRNIDTELSTAKARQKATSVNGHFGFPDQGNIQSSG